LVSLWLDQQSEDNVSLACVGVVVVVVAGVLESQMEVEAYLGYYHHVEVASEDIYPAEYWLMEPQTLVRRMGIDLRGLSYRTSVATVAFVVSPFVYHLPLELMADDGMPLPVVWYFVDGHYI
jgi:hypothetical protein